MAKILVIEDDDLGRELYLTVLKKNGHEVIPAESGQDGLDAFDETVDLVITDIIMEHMDGYEVIDELKQRAPQVKIIAISGAATIGTLDTLKLAQKYGAQAVLSKPIDWREMVKTINQLLEQDSRQACKKWSDHDGMMAQLKKFLADYHDAHHAAPEPAMARTLLLEKGYPDKEIDNFLEVVWQPALAYYTASLEEVS